MTLTKTAMRSDDLTQMTPATRQLTAMNSAVSATR
jgi:hypothetical protein